MLLSASGKGLMCRHDCICVACFGKGTRENGNRGLKRKLPVGRTGESRWEGLMFHCTFTIKVKIHPGWCGSVDWGQACELKGSQFDSWSGHMPGLQAGSPMQGA